jgi:Glycosyl transferase family 64 domain
MARLTSHMLHGVSLQTRREAADQLQCPRPAPGTPRMERIPYQNGTAPADDAKYTLLLNSFQRHDLLKRSISHYARCPGLDAIRVVWCEDQVRPQHQGWCKQHAAS